MSAKSKIILAVDRPDLASAMELLDGLAGELVWAKIGLQLFTAEGPKIVREVLDRGFRVFLDLKFHDIPNTAKEAVASARELGVSMTTLHLCGGPEMIRAAMSEAGDMLVLGVTVLTSMDEPSLRATGVQSSPAEQVLALAGMGAAAGIRGVVASPQEISLLRKAHGPDLKIVTPGVRPSGSDVGDQKRVATPLSAIRDGADYLVVGRPISGAPDPRAAFLQIADEVASAQCHS
jgi:orotidine-5'-phosphate decarboxylase